MSYKKREVNGYTEYINETGKKITVYGRDVIVKDGYVFKDLEGTGELLPYEDWRLDATVRAEDLAGRMTVEEKMGLMLHTASQSVPVRPNTMMYPGTYSGKKYDEMNVEPWTLTDQQKELMEKRGVRHFLVAYQQDIETAVRWNNEMQQFAERLPHGIPINVSSDPRHGVGDGNVEYKSAGEGVSKWPEGIGMAAMFSLEQCKEYAEIASKEYRALGITTMLGPQIDVASDPRWMRIPDTAGAHAGLSAEIARVYCDGLQTTEGSNSGWGDESVIAMAKHWPGGGTGEGGRDAHYPFGKYAVYPGGNFEEHLKPFIEGAMKLEGKTQKCAAIMPYYTISWNQDCLHGENVGNSYSEYIIRDLLRNKYGYDEVVCTDWNIFPDMTPAVGMYVLGGKCHGVEGLSVTERFLEMIMNGVDQFGSAESLEDIKKAYTLGCEINGTEMMEELIHRSAVKILRNIFRTGLFENPFLYLEESQKVVGCQEHMEKGYRAQLSSIVLLKNKNQALPLKKGISIYIPERYIAEHYGFVRMKVSARQENPLSGELAGEYFRIVDNPDEADAAVVFVESPYGDGGYELEDEKQGKTGYRPISLQYRPYCAEEARAVSIAGGDPREKDNNRTYRGRCTTTANESDLDNVIQMRKCMKNRPVIVCMRMKTPAIMAELEPYADAILVEFGVQKRAVLDILTGGFQPSGRLPVRIPESMEAIERHCEDNSFDFEPYRDSEGQGYDFGYGMSFEGVLTELGKWRV